ncbi:hypothetical protein ERO13_D01G064260v2 [Gossypium hirsutum]|nr:hypothetical protein ERO13_D01G064260v2 [Gossypium hirsutum]
MTTSVVTINRLRWRSTTIGSRTLAISVKRCQGRQSSGDASANMARSNGT